MNDSISTMISSIKNGFLAGKNEVVFPYSKFREEVLKVLVEEGFLEKIAVNEKDFPKKIICTLRYKNKKSVINEIKMISKPGLRVYKKVNEGRKVLGGLGRRIVSTSAGVMTDDEAKKKRLGGEVILEVY